MGCHLLTDSIKEKLRRRTAGILLDQDFREHAVLLPLVRHENKVSLLFEVRSLQLKDQPGEICFPGGHIEPQDSTPQHTAVRETVEELGVQSSSLDILGPLDILVTHHQLKIYPFVAMIQGEPALTPDQREVDHVFYVPLDFLLAARVSISQVRMKMQPEPGFPFHLIPGGTNYAWREGQYPVYFYHYQDYIIWGMTARILHHFLGLIR